MEIRGRREEPLAPRDSRAHAGLWAVALIVAGAVPAVAAPPSMDEWRIEPFEWQGALDSGHRLTVRNPHGDVRARRSTSGDVAIFAAMQRHAGDPRAWRVAIEPVNGDLEVAVALGDAAVPAPLPADWSPRRIDLTVFVPDGAQLRVETGAGRIEAKRLRSDIEARSTSGEIVVTGSGSVEARSETGAIRYSFLSADWAGAARLSSGTGDITLVVPRDAAIDLTLRTRGEIAGVAIPAASGSNGERRLVVGGGGSPVVAESDTGRIALHRIPS